VNNPGVVYFAAFTSIFFFDIHPLAVGSGTHRPGIGLFLVSIPFAIGNTQYRSIAKQ
jgi:hypothetical protein